LSIEETERLEIPMAYDETLAQRMRDLFESKGVPTQEKKMFGGLTFMVRGNMCVGVIGEELMIRVGKEQNDEALAQPHARPMDFTGKPMDGYVYVESEGLASDAELAEWVERGLTFNATLKEK